MARLWFGKKRENKSRCGCEENSSNPCSCNDLKSNNVGSDEKEEMVMCECGNMCKASDVEAKKAKKDLEQKGVAIIRVLGSGCKKCNDLEGVVKQALAILGKNTTVDHVTDFAEIAAYGVMSMPALVVNGKIVSAGKVLKVDEAIKILEKFL